MDAFFRVLFEKNINCGKGLNKNSVYEILLLKRFDTISMFILLNQI